MFDSIFDAIEEWMRDLLTGMVTSNLTTMFTDVNEKTGEIATQVGMTPQGWNSSIYNMVQSLSNSVIVPIAGIIITMVLCYELISMLTERNNLHDVDTWMFFKYFFKMWVAVFLVSNTWTITMAVFDVGQSVVNSAAGTISGSTTIDISSFTSTINTTMESMELGELFVLMLETFILSFCMKVMSVLIMVIMFGRNRVVEFAKNLKPSARGELEITDLNRIYLEDGTLNVELLGQGFTWLDTGTHESLVDATNFVKTVEQHQHRKIACLEEIAYLNGWISKDELMEVYEVMKKNQYGQYLKDVMDGKYQEHLY